MAKKLAKKKIAHKTSVAAPKAERPNMPGYGLSKSRTGLLPWKWAEDRLGKSRQYWMATTRPDGSPHVMIVWGLWLAGAFYFSTGKNSRKARNLAKNPHCVIGSENAAEAVIVEGVVESITDREKLEPLYVAYQKKYKWDIRGMDEPFYRARPGIAFGLFEKKFTGTATRWTFPK